MPPTLQYWNTDIINMDILHELLTDIFAKIMEACDQRTMTFLHPVNACTNPVTALALVDGLPRSGSFAVHIYKQEGKPQHAFIALGRM